MLEHRDPATGLLRFPGVVSDISKREFLVAIFGGCGCGAQKWLHAETTGVRTGSRGAIAFELCEWNRLPDFSSVIYDVVADFNGVSIGGYSEVFFDGHTRWCVSSGEDDGFGGASCVIAVFRSVVNGSAVGINAIGAYQAGLHDICSL